MGATKKLAVRKRIYPVLIEQDEDGLYVIECPEFKGCYAQGKTLDEAIDNIKEVISLCLEETPKKQLFRSSQLKSMSLHTIAV